MNRVGVGMLIAAAGLAMHTLSGTPGQGTDAMPEGVPEPAAHTEAAAPMPQGKRVLGLILALEALRAAAPEEPDKPKV